MAPVCPSAPGGPGGPPGPAGPSAPRAPAGPAAPGGPGVPCGPCTFQESSDSSGRQSLGESTTRRPPASFCRQATMVFEEGAAGEVVAPHENPAAPTTTKALSNMPRFDLTLIG